MVNALRRAWWRLKARLGVASAKASPQVKAAMVERYVAEKEAAVAQRRKRVKPGQEGYVHEKVEESKGVQAGRKPGELDPKRVSKSARTEERLRKLSVAEWEKALKKGGKPE